MAHYHHIWAIKFDINLSTIYSVKRLFIQMLTFLRLKNPLGSNLEKSLTFSSKIMY